MNRVGSKYRPDLPRQSFDAIVVGSGVGGLTTAALLARTAKKRVLVLERHYMPGGFTHVYRRHGYEWDVGVHYIGEVGNPQSGTRQLLDRITDGSLEWESMGAVYDRIVVGERSYDFEAGSGAFAARMKNYFPAESGAIDRYLELIHRTAKASRMFFAEKAVPAPIAFIAGTAMRSSFLKLARRSTKEVLDELTDNAELKGVLTAQYGDYGLEPGKSSFAMHAILVRHYLHGAYYPIGGSSAIAAAIAPVIEEAGGQILYQAEVAEILVRRGRAVGVRLVDGAEFEAPLVISDAGVHNTYRRLLPPAVAATFGLTPKAERHRPSVSHLCLYVGFKQSAAALELPKHNFWIYPGPDHDANVAAYLADPANPDTPLPLVYLSFPSAKDPSFAERYPDRATIELLTLAPYEMFAPWRDTEWGKRGSDYEALKANFAERLLDQLDGQLPGLRQQIDYMEVSTPLSTQHFAGYQRGEIYGLSHSPERFLDRSLRPRTPIRGLYLTGQDVATCGVAGALAAGYLTTSAILGKNLLK